MAAITRFGLEGYGVRRTGSFAGRAPVAGQRTKRSQRSRALDDTVRERSNVATGRRRNFHG